MADEERQLIYIAGPIANTTDFVERFKAARVEVAALGYQPVCPIELNGVDETSRQEDSEQRRAYLRKDIAALINCHGIYMLEGWWNSRGARLEHMVAQGLDLLVLYQNKSEQLASGYDAGPRTLERMHKERNEQ